MRSAIARRLSPDFLAKTIRSGEEYDWRFEDVQSVLVQARSLGLAALGGVQFKLPDGTCEAYWKNADATARRDGEAWDSYLGRSHREVRAELERLPSANALPLDDLDHFAFLKQWAAEGVNLRPCLYFICYVEAKQV